MVTPSSLKQRLYEYLSGHRLVKAQVGTKVYPLQAPTSAALPFITFQRIAQKNPHDMDAASILVNPTVEISCWGSTSVEVESVADAVRNALDGFQERWMNDLRIGACSLENEFDVLVPPTDGSEQSIYRTVMTFSIWHERSAPTL